MKKIIILLSVVLLASCSVSSVTLTSQMRGSWQNSVLADESTGAPAGVLTITNNKNELSSVWSITYENGDVSEKSGTYVAYTYAKPKKVDFGKTGVVIFTFTKENGSEIELMSEEYYVYFGKNEAKEKVLYLKETSLGANDLPFSLTQVITE